MRQKSSKKVHSTDGNSQSDDATPLSTSRTLPLHEQPRLPLELNSYYSYAKRNNDDCEKTEVAMADRVIVEPRAEYPWPIKYIPYESPLIKKLPSSCPADSNTRKAHKSPIPCSDCRTLPKKLLKGSRKRSDFGQFSTKTFAYQHFRTPCEPTHEVFTPPRPPPNNL